MHAPVKLGEAQHQALHPPSPAPSPPWLSAVGWITSALPIILLALLVRTHAVDIPHWDDWESLQLVADVRANAFDAASLLAPHVEHRWAVPRLVWLALGLGGEIDVRLMNYVAVGLAAAAFLALFFVVRATLDSRAAGMLLLFLAGLALASPLQWQAWLWPSNVAYLFVIASLFGGACLSVVQNRPTVATTLFPAIALFGTISFSAGLALWPAFFVAVLLMSLRRRIWHPVVLFSLAAGVVGFLYFAGLQNEAHFSHTPDGKGGSGVGPFFAALVAAPGETVGRAAIFALSLLGAPLARGTLIRTVDFAPVCGVGLLVAGLAAFAIACRICSPSGWRRLVPWILLMVFGGLSAAFITIGRLETTSDQAAMLVRYMMFTTPFIIGLLGFIAVLIDQCDLLRTRRTWCAMLVGGVAGGYLMLQVVLWAYGAKQMEFWSHARTQGQAGMLFLKSLPWLNLWEVEGDRAYLQNAHDRLVAAGVLENMVSDSLDLAQFKISDKPLRATRADWYEPETRGSSWHVSGHAFLARSERTPDLVLFTTKQAGERKIFDAVHCRALPPILRAVPNHDFEFQRMTLLSTPLFGRWETELRTDLIQPGLHEVEAWMLDIRKGRVYRIGEARQLEFPPKATN